MSPARIKRQALIVGLGTFGGDRKPEGEPEPGLRDFPFASDRIRDLAAALEPYGYQINLLKTDGDQPSPTAEELGMHVMRAAAQLGPNDVLLVHILSHGLLTEEGVLYVVGADGAHHKETEVEHWLKSLQRPDSPHVLFLLDLCHSGASARSAWQLAVADGRARAWVLAACEPEHQAFDGRFTQAVTNVLNQLASSDAQFSNSSRYVPVDTLARLVKTELKDLAELEDGYPQRVTGSLLDISAQVPDLSFFPNPRFNSAPRLAPIPHMHSGLVPFVSELDEGLDPDHFMERAEGFGVLRREQGLGCFSGRKRELKILSAWLDGHDPARFRVVTGSPGVGKSALVGVVVCAAHPQLRQRTERIWKHLEPTPYKNSKLAAVHARQRNLAGIVASIRYQLALGRDEDNVDLASFFERIRRSDRPPTIVIDALDEADKYQQVATDLLLPLSSLDRPDGTPACKLLVATRPWPEFQAVLGAAENLGGLVDLDQVPDDLLSTDLEDYISALLRHQPPYNAVSHAGARQTFAASVAAALTSTRLEANDKRWGEFLVAGLYTHHLVTTHNPIKDIEEMARLGASVPLTLPALLELELAARQGVTWLRPLLVALAHSRGDGMPIETAIRAAEVFAPAPLGRATSADIIAALKAARFYLRPAADTDGSMLYRLFVRHDGAVVPDGGERPPISSPS